MDSVLSSLQHRRPQLRKARAHERRDNRMYCISRSVSDARRGAHRFPGMNLLGASTWQERRCSIPFGVPSTSLRIDQNKKKNYTATTNPKCVPPVAEFLAWGQERQKNWTRGSSKFLSAAFYPILPMESFVRRECSRLTRFSSEVADETRRERHASLAREGWLGNFLASPFFPPVWTRSNAEEHEHWKAHLRCYNVTMRNWLRNAQLQSVVFGAL